MEDTKVGWTVETLPSDWWSSTSTSKPSLVYNFWVYFSGNIAASDIEYVHVISIGANWMWPIDPTKGFNATDSYIGGTGYCFGSYTDELPIGPMKAEIKLTNGTVSDFPFTVGYPGSSTAGGNSYVFSKDDETSAQNGPATRAMLRPTVTGSVISGGTSIAVSFTVPSSEARNGYIWYYDSSNEYIGRSPFFLDPASGVITPKLAGSIFHTDGTKNTLTVLPADVVDSSSKPIASTAFNAIARCRVVVIDGHQYDLDSTKNYLAYDFRAISPRVQM
jgi:hypothetical protein